MTDNNNFRNVGGSVYGGMVSGGVYSQSGPMRNKARSDNNNFGQHSQQKQTLSDAAEEIQQLLKQLEKTNPTATEAEKVAYVNDETSPSFKRRAVRALQGSGEDAIEEFLDTRYVIVGKAIVKGWIKSE
jgi:hypothetical protein